MAQAIRNSRAPKAADVEKRLKGRLSVVASKGEAEIVDRAVEVIGNKDDAMRWMGTPIRALDYATPISLVHKQKGRDAVLTVLGRLEHGLL
jgi:putative toxin-antitoxin system antitoxin component (TIGR02293 family)